MATVYDLKLKILQHMGEDLVEGTYPALEPLAGSDTTAQHLLSSIHAALNALCVRVWKPSVIDIEADELSPVDMVTMPSDMISIEGVYDSYLKQFIPRSYFRVGQSLTAGNSNAWLDYPFGTVSFSNVLESGGKIYYSAHWALPSDDEDELEAPNICLEYLALYAASYCLLRKLALQGELRQFATKVDAGNPIQLTYKEVSDVLLKRAEIELKNLPATPKGIS